MGTTLEHKKYIREPQIRRKIRTQIQKIYKTRNKQTMMRKYPSI